MENPDAATPGGKAPEKPPEEKTDLKDIVTTDFMKGLVDDLNLDIDQDAMGDLMKEVGKKPDEAKGKDDEKKDGKDDKDKPPAKKDEEDDNLD